MAKSIFQQYRERALKNKQQEETNKQAEIAKAEQQRNMSDSIKSKMNQSAPADISRNLATQYNKPAYKPLVNPFDQPKQPQGNYIPPQNRVGKLGQTIQSAPAKIVTTALDVINRPQNAVVSALSGVQDLRNKPVEVKKQIKKDEDAFYKALNEISKKPLSEQGESYKKLEKPSTLVDPKALKNPLEKVKNYGSTIENSDAEDYFLSFSKGLTKGLLGKERRDPLEAMGYSKEEIQKKYKESPKTTTIASFAAGLALDPSTYIGVGALKNIAIKVTGKVTQKVLTKIASKTITLADLAEAAGKTQKLFNKAGKEIVGSTVYSEKEILGMLAKEALKTNKSLPQAAKDFFEKTVKENSSLATRKVENQALNDLLDKVKLTTPPLQQASKATKEVTGKAINQSAQTITRETVEISAQQTTQSFEEALNQLEPPNFFPNRFPGLQDTIKRATTETVPKTVQKEVKPITNNRVNTLNDIVNNPTKYPTDMVERAKNELSQSNITPKAPPKTPAKTVDNTEIKTNQPVLKETPLQTPKTVQEAPSTKFVSKYKQSVESAYNDLKGVLKDSDYIRERNINKDTAEAAYKNISKDFEGTKNRILKDSDNSFKNAIETAEFDAIIDTHIRKGEIKSAIDFINRASSRVTETAQALQQLAAKGKYTPGNMLTTAKKMLDSSVPGKVIQRATKESGEIAQAMQKVNKEALEEITKGFNLNLQLFAKKFNLDTAIRKNLDDKLSNIVKQHYSRVEAASKELKQRIIEQTGLKEPQATELANQIKKRFNDLTKERKEKILALYVKPRAKYNKKNIQDRIIELSNLGAFDKSAYKDLIYEKYKIPKLDEDLARSIIQQSNKIQKMNNVFDRQAATNKMMADIQNKINPSLLNKIMTVRKMAMLSGTKTLLVRNPFGNAAMGTTYRATKAIDTAIDATLSKFTGRERQITFRTGRGKEAFSEFFKDLAKGAKAGWKGYSLYGTDSLEIGGKIFKGKYNPLNYLESTIGATLRGVDFAFYQNAVKNSIGETAWLRSTKEGLTGSARKAATKKYTNDIINSALKVSDFTKDALTKADLAGKYVTFQGDNFFSKAFTGTRSFLNKIPGGVAGDTLIPFAKTPGALISIGLEYSPLGVFKSIVQISRAALGKTVTRAEAINSFSKALLGTGGLTGAGAYLASKGAVTGSSPTDPKARNFLQDNGMSQYSVNLSAITRWAQSWLDDEQLKPQKGDTWYSYDWLQPISTAFGVGANIGSKNGVNDIASAIPATIGESIKQVSDNQTIANILEPFKTKDVKESAVKTFADVPSSFIPQVVNNIRQITDNTSRETKSDNTMEYVVNLIKNRIPGISKNLPERKTSSGETKQIYPNNTNQWYNVLFNPGFLNKLNTTPSTQFLLDLYKNTGSKSQLPRIADTEITINNKKLKLSKGQQARLQSITNQKVIEILDNEVNKKEFQVATEQQQIKYIEKILDRVGDYGRKKLLQELGENYIKENLK